MEKDKIVVGLDIGSTKICVVVGRKDAQGKIEVLGVGKATSEGVERGVVTNIRKAVEVIQKAVEAASKSAGIDIVSVNVGVAGQHIKSSLIRGSLMRQSTQDEISTQDVEQLINDMYKVPTPPGTRIIHVMPQEFIVDGEPNIKEPVGMSGVKIEADFHVITANQTAINNIQRCVEMAGLRIDEVILEPIASSMSVLSKDEKQSGVVLVDIGGGTTDIAVFYENIIRHTAVIPFGGAIVTKDIKEGCMILPEHAESLKVLFGKAIAEQAPIDEAVSIPGIRNRSPKEISVRNLASIIEARMKEIIEDVHTEIITSRYEGKLSMGIVLTGGGSLLKGIKELFGYMTGLEVRRGLPTEHLSHHKIELIKNPIFATSVGLVIAGFRALDDRESLFANNNITNATPTPLNPSTNNTTNATPTQPQTSQEKNETKKEVSFFQKLLEKTKSLLLDDIDDKKDY